MSQSVVRAPSPAKTPGAAWLPQGKDVWVEDDYALATLCQAYILGMLKLVEVIALVVAVLIGTALLAWARVKP
jgi:hypothetical protein